MLFAQQPAILFTSWKWTLVSENGILNHFHDKYHEIMRK